MEKNFLKGGALSVDKLIEERAPPTNQGEITIQFLSCFSI